MDEDDLQIENLMADPKAKKKKVDGKAKGDRTELNLAKLLTRALKVEFSRALGSGSRWSQVSFLPEHAKKSLIGDLCVPEFFKWVIECKGGYKKEMDLASLWEGVTCLDEFIEQVERDSKYCGRQSIIMWKRNNKPWLAILKAEDCEGFDIAKHWPTCIRYQKGDKIWVMGQLKVLLENTDKGFWFNQ